MKLKHVKFYNSQTIPPTNRWPSAYHQWYQYHRLKSTAVGYKALQSGEHSPKFRNILLYSYHYCRLGYSTYSGSKMEAECSSGISKYILDYSASLSTMLVIFIPIAVRIPTPTNFRITRSYLELTYVGFWTDWQVVPSSFTKDYDKIVINQTIEPFQFVYCWTVPQWWCDNRPFVK